MIANAFVNCELLIFFSNYYLDYLGWLVAYYNCHRCIGKKLLTLAIPLCLMKLNQVIEFPNLIQVRD